MDMMLQSQCGRLDPVAVSRFNQFKNSRPTSFHRSSKDSQKSFRFDSTPILMLRSPQETISYLLRQSVKEPLKKQAPKKLIHQARQSSLVPPSVKLDSPKNLLPIKQALNADIASDI